MSDQHSREISIFLAAIETKGTEELRSYLDDACGDDRQLRTDVEALLVAHLKDNSFLEHPAPVTAQAIDLNRHSLDAGLAATFGPDAAIVIGNASHSVLKSLNKRLSTTPTIILRENGEPEGKVVQLGSKEFSTKQTDSRYQLHGEIARGGMGAIIKGRDTDLGRDLAIKVLLDEHKDKPEMLQRFVEEAQIGGQLQHPGIVPVYELGLFNDERPFFSMKLVKGDTLAELLAIRKNPQENLPKLLGIFEQVCQAMAYAHSKGVVHRDLKPANIMIGAFGEVQVMDWGLSKVLSKGGVADERKSLDKHRNVSVIQTRRSVGSDVPGDGGSNTQLGSVMGTPAYMPPEQALGEIDRLDERADVFGLGAILAEILSGKPPYVADDATQVFRMASRGKLDECFARLNASGVDGELIEMAKRALSAEVDDRQRNAGEISAGITKHLEGVQTRLKQAEFAKVEAETRSEEQRRRKKLYMAIAGMLLLLAFSGAAGTVLYKQTADAQTNFAQSQTELAQSKSELVVETQRNLDEQVRLRENAEKETQRANVMRLAAEAQRIEKDLPIRSVLEAMEAVKMSDDNKLWPIPIAHETLLKSVANLGGLPLPTQAGQLKSMTMSQNDRMVTGSFNGVGVSDSNSFQVWNLTKEDPSASSFPLPLEDGTQAWSSDISSDGHRVVTGSMKSARVWELSLDSDQIVSSTDLPGQLGNVHTAISPDGQWVVTSGDVRGAKIQLFRIDKKGQATFSAELPHSSKHTQFAISPNNHWLVKVGGDDSENGDQAFIWDLRSTDIPGSVKSLEHTGKNSSVAIGPEGRWLVTGSSDGARLFDLVASDIPLSVRKLTSEKLGQVTISENGRWLIGAGMDSWLFDLSALEPATSAIILRGHESSGTSVAISPDGRWLATGNKDARIWDMNSINPLELPILKDHAGNSARLWDVYAIASTGRTRVLRGHDTRVMKMFFTSDNRRLITSGMGAIRIWNTESENPQSGTVLLGHNAPVSAVAITPDLRWAVTGSYDNTARLWDLTSDFPSASPIILPHPEFVRTMAISPDSHWLVTASGQFSNAPTGTVTEARVWDLTAEDPSKTMRLLSGHEKAVTHVKISPDSRRVVTLSSDHSPRVWNLDGANPNQESRVLRGHTKLIVSVAFSPDSNALVTGDTAGIVHFWDLTAPDPIAPKILLDHENWVMGLSLETSRARALTAGWQQRTHILDLDLNLLTQPKSRELPNKGFYTIHKSDIRGNMLCLPNGLDAQIWDLSASQNTSPTLTHTHENGVSSIALSPDGSRFASCGGQTIHVSDLSAENPLDTTLVLRGHESAVTSVAVSSDNRWVLTGSTDNTARLWDMDIERLMARARKLVGRELTDKERERYLIPERK